MSEQKWPDRLWIVRHGESAGNVARDRAHAASSLYIDYDTRDADVPLSPLGERQADALGRWFACLPQNERPDVFLCSPYVRAQQTMRRALRQAGIDCDRIRLDERLREREFGIFDGLTKLGVRERYPDQAKALDLIGKFYHRPPGGESWCDVILRLRSLLDTLTREYRGGRVLVVAHQVTVLCFRYLLERMSEAQILGIDREQDVANCAITGYAFDPTRGHTGKLVLDRYNFVSPLVEAGETVTTEPDVPVGPK
ncbi:histidine phosphatase family protein [Cognatilysobacter lacus]|uniref:phosphoglycerate mutase (2,3-diphosphoglycerate-dependent) n=1 Tax=Cognatilysobacter lacus TaxID=1643323 RepID=A0A5D8Z378_9GAMM|nr:histidine phosphatase family protein [Lysobacter lacus]TZF89189.1 histidine phosphatase family protein [Lysobacter lacus]